MAGREIGYRLRSEASQTPSTRDPGGFIRSQFHRPGETGRRRRCGFFGPESE